MNSPDASGVGFVGLRTERFDEMVGFFRDLLGLELIHAAPGAAWFRLGRDTELHVYASGGESDHAFFTTGPVVGLVVADVDAARDRMERAGIGFVTEIERSTAASWCHFRAPDGTVMEIIAPQQG